MSKENVESSGFIKRVGHVEIFYKANNYKAKSMATGREILYREAMDIATKLLAEHGAIGCGCEPLAAFELAAKQISDEEDAEMSRPKTRKQEICPACGTPGCPVEKMALTGDCPDFTESACNVFSMM